MDVDSQLYISNSCPNIYKVEIELTSFNDLLVILSDEIVQGCTFSNLDAALVDYVTSVIEPVGWKAVWRSSKESLKLDVEYDFLVEVANVSLEKLEADIFFKSIITTDSNPPYLEQIKDKLKTENPITVPLVELYVVSEDDPEELFAKTAVAIEHVRFFLKNICRPWDVEDDVLYTEEILKSRLQLYFDMKNNILPKTMISKVKSVLREGARIQKELKRLYTDMNVSDSEAEISEEDLMQSMTLRRKLEKLQAKMEMLENPVIRSFVTKKYAPTKPQKRRAKSCPVTYVVSKMFTREMISSLSIESNSVLEFEHNPEVAFKFSSTGDKIFIFPGVYQCDSLGWIEGDIFVQGVGQNSEIILEATGNSEVLLNCCTQNVDLQNICLKAKTGLLSAIVVHHGKINLKNVIINSNDAEIGLLLLGGSEATMENCSICNSSEDGVQMRSLSSLTMKSSKVVFSERHGIQLDAECTLSTESFTDLNIYNSHITNNGGYGVFLNNVPITDISLQRPDGDFSVLKLFPWLRHDIEGTNLESNGANGIGISSTCKNNLTNNNSSNSSLTTVNCTMQDNLNYSALSDLLNEVNLSIDNQDSVFE